MATARSKSAAYPTSSTTNKLVVAAIDFGTTYSGYAYSFRDELKNDPLKIYCNGAWLTGGEGLCTLKTSTTILFNKRGEFDSFGFEAETRYAELAEEGEHSGWRYFRHFKMKLHDKSVSIIC